MTESVCFCSIPLPNQLCQRGQIISQNCGKEQRTCHTKQFLWGVSATRGAHLGSFFPVCKQPRQRGELETVNINPKAATQGCEEQNGHWESSMVADIPEDTWMEEQIQLAFTELVLD